MNLKRIIFISSLVLNFILTCYLYVYLKHNEVNLKDEIINDDKFELRNHIVYDQLFYGTWKIVNLVPPDISIPSSYTALNAEGELIRDVESIIGTVLTFKDSYIEHDGERHELVYGFQTYSHTLPAKNDIIFYNHTDTLGITGDFYSIVYFIHPNNSRNIESNDGRLNKIYVGDLIFLILKDDNTIYASNSVLTYRLERVTEE